MNDVTVFLGGSQGCCGDSINALVLKRVTMGEGGPKVSKNDFIYERLLISLSIFYLRKGHSYF